MKKKTKSGNKNRYIYQYILPVAGYLLLGFAMLNIGLSTSIGNDIKTSEEDAIEEAKTPEIQITYIKDVTCNECADLQSIITGIGNQEVNIINVNELDSGSDEAIALIDSYAVTKLPILIITGEFDKNEKLNQLFTQAGYLSGDAVVIDSYTPPYKVIATGEIKGITRITLLDDASCDECYDPNAHLAILRNMGMGVNEVQTYDVSESQGQSIVQDFNIDLVPTLLIAGDYVEYTSLIQIWPNVGTEENDTLVFRDGVRVMGTYKSLSTGEVITPKKESSTELTYATITPQEFSTIMKGKNTILLDVRTQEEYDESHLEGATLIPLDEIQSRLGELNKDDEILVYCRSGNRSAQASQILIDNGFENISHLEGGILNWEEVGLPIVR